MPAEAGIQSVDAKWACELENGGTWVSLNLSAAWNGSIAAHFAGLSWDGQPLSFHWNFALTEAITASLTLDGWCILYFGIKHYRTVEQQRVRLLSSEASARDAQLLALHYQLRPHFLFNTLNAISTLVVSWQLEKATEMIAKRAGLLRNTLSLPGTHTVALQEELAVVEKYLAIERVRFGTRLRLS